MIRLHHAPLLALAFAATPSAAASQPSVQDIQGAYERAASETPERHVAGLTVVGAACDPSDAGRWSCQIGFKTPTDAERVFLDAVLMEPLEAGRWKLIGGLCRRL